MTHSIISLSTPLQYFSLWIYWDRPFEPKVIILRGNLAIGLIKWDIIKSIDSISINCRVQLYNLIYYKKNTLVDWFTIYFDSIIIFLLMSLCCLILRFQRHDKKIQYKATICEQSLSVSKSKWKTSNENTFGLDTRSVMI